MRTNDEGGASVSDEEWARFLAEAEAGAGQAPKEPSARARMVTARLREEEARNGSAGPPAWRSAPAFQGASRRGRGGRRIKAALAIACVAGLALIAIRPELVIDRVTGKAARDAEARQQLSAETARPTAAPSAVDPDRPTLAEPFKGSPAAQWADGAAGIEVPEAAAVGGMTKEQVAGALVKAKQFLVLANLDPATLRGERPEAALALLDPKLGAYKAGIEEGLTSPTKEKDPLDFFSRADPAELRLVGDVVKVRGRMWIEPGEKPGKAEVRTDVTFVYPFVKARPGAEQVERTVVRRELTFSIADPRRWEATAGALWVEANLRNIGNSECDSIGFLHPRFDDEAPAGPTPSGTPVDPYDRSESLGDRNRADCGTLSRS